VASSITDQGILLSLRALDRVIDVDPSRRIARVQPGVILGDLKRELAKDGLLFAPDPTSEDECTLGGAIAANASGARSLKYGATRRHVRGLTVLLADGQTLVVRRSSVEKNTAGFQPLQDLVDWFVGSEGTLGVIVEAELDLLPLPAAVIGFGFPFPAAADAFRFIAQARESGSVSPRCLEYLDERAFAIAREALGQNSWSPGAGAFVYAEQENDGQSEPVIDAWHAIADSCGVRADDVRVFSSEPELREARRMRHAVPSTLNARAAAHWKDGGRKVSTDWAVPYRRLGEALDLSAAIAERHGLEAPYTFGHAGNGHPHQNYIARNADQLRTVESVLRETLEGVIALGGTISAEHGVGKLKKHWLPLQLSPLQLALMRSIKSVFDPRGILAPGNLL
jgi:FAD/FMN-containing dehydrogenase